MAVVRSKLQRYRELATSGLYQQLFQTRSLRVLFVFAGSREATTSQRITRAAQEAKRAGVTLARFADLDVLKTLSPEACLVGAVWQGAEGDEGTAQPLFHVP
jgi:hypothetical protein